MPQFTVFHPEMFKDTKFQIKNSANSKKNSKFLIYNLISNSSKSIHIFIQTRVFVPIIFSAYIKTRIKSNYPVLFFYYCFFMLLYGEIICDLKVFFLCVRQTCFKDLLAIIVYSRNLFFCAADCKNIFLFRHMTMSTCYINKR